MMVTVTESWFEGMDLIFPIMYSFHYVKKNKTKLFFMSQTLFVCSFITIIVT